MPPSPTRPSRLPPLRFPIHNLQSSPPTTPTTNSTLPHLLQSLPTSTQGVSPSSQQPRLSYSKIRAIRVWESLVRWRRIAKQRRMRLRSRRVETSCGSRSRVTMPQMGGTWAWKWTCTIEVFCEGFDEWSGWYWLLIACIMGGWWLWEEELE